MLQVADARPYNFCGIRLYKKDLKKIMTKKTYESTVEYNEDFDEYFIPLPEEMLENLGWEDGDVLEWHLNKDGTVFLERIDNFGEEDEEE